MDPGTCDSCGGEGRDDLAALHRLYVTPAAWDTEEEVTELAEVEHWCIPCRTHYPHRPVAEGSPG